MKTLLHAILTASTLLLAACASSGGAGVKSYPLKTCLVTGNELGGMGPPVTRVYNGQEIKFCCKPCIAKFEAAPGKYLARLPK